MIIFLRSAAFRGVAPAGGDALEAGTYFNKNVIALEHSISSKNLLVSLTNEIKLTLNFLGPSFSW